jgi:uncharacterized protein (DUF3820 family)
MIINFGKHAGTELSKLPIDYLVWLQDLDKNPNGIIRDGVNWSQLAQEEFIRRKTQGYTETLFGEPVKHVL